MDFSLTAEQEMFVDTVRRFARDELAPRAAEQARAPGYPWPVAQRMAALGLMGIALPESEGGMGGTLVEAILAIQAVAEACPRSGDVIQAGNFGPVRTFAEYGTAEQKARFLGPVLEGRSVISLAMTEPQAGSAVTELATRAIEDGDDFIVNGTKIFGTYSAEAEVFLVYVRFGPGLDGIGSLLIEKGMPGFTIGRPAAFMNGEDWVPALFRRRPCSARQPRPRSRRFPQADGGVQRRTAGQCGARGGGWTARLQPGARARAGAPAVRPCALRVSGPAMEIRRHGDQA